MKLRTYMTDRDISPEDMAAKVGDVSASGVRKWVYEERTPRPDQMRRIAEVTDNAVTPNDFILAEAQS